MEELISNVRYKISKGARVLTQGDPEFAVANERWTDIDRKIPAVIVQPVSEDDVAMIVSHSLSYHDSTSTDSQMYLYCR